MITMIIKLMGVRGVGVNNNEFELERWRRNKNE